MIGKAVQVGVAALLLLVGVRTFVAIGWVTPIVVEGSSMAPTLVGPHANPRCDTCGRSVRIGADQLPASPEINCPLCGAGRLDLDAAGRLAGDRLLVDRWNAEPRRWDIVVAHRPDDATRLCVKRVVGLPGERIDFRGGDLFIYGTRVVKSLAAQRRLRIPLRSIAWRHTAEECVAEFAPPTDDLPHNQRVTRRLNRVADLMLTATFDDGNGGVALSLRHAGRDLHARLDWPRQRATLVVDGAKAHLPLANPHQQTFPVEVTLSLFDLQALLAVGDAVVAQAPLARPDWGGGMSEAAISGGGLANEPKLWRDVHYEWRPADRPAAAPLGPDAWFLVGDNQAVSHDSRRWRPAGVPGRLLVGRVWQSR